ncbi:polymorphic toxin type 44 domain-containing protein [Streptococcus intermedius]|uniref:polymorphic toxin type 44 domain-containing protein n=3 Tax=Streptococcus intermedius TaxID=1338 RepID=UPI000C83E7A0|nr:polymorphic toxin type 44 domain-containing protein [Streptococcus intermedius]PMR63634.1 hypothetical protein C1I61_08260 [Streptococcus intermedius]WOI91774.1 polymorphic toxin type 44 domain-containing protein [Streptococcus intermedius]
MDLAASDEQASSMGRVSANRIAGYQSAISALEAFTNASDLTGAAYESAKRYGASVLTPLIQGAILLSEGVSQGTTALPNKYRAEVGEESLDSDVLESQIQAYESSLSSLRGIYRYLERDCSTKPSTLRSMSSRMTSLSNQKTEAMEKLRKLNAFAMSSPMVFSNLPEVSAAMDVGIGQVQTAFANFNGSFQVPSADQLGWTRTIGIEWKKKEELDRAYQRVLDKLKNGEKLTDKDIKAIEAYQKRYPGRELPEDVHAALKAESYNIKQAKVLKKQITEIKKSNLPASKKVDAIVKAYEDYLFHTNKKAFEEYWKKRKAIGDDWGKNNTEIRNKKKKIEKEFFKSVTPRTDIKTIAQNMGDDILDVKKIEDEKKAELIHKGQNIWKSPGGSGLVASSSAIGSKLGDNGTFIDLVNTKKPLDLKNRIYGDNYPFSVWGRQWEKGMTSDYMGNYLFGYVGKGYLRANDVYLKLGAGAAQGISDKNPLKYIENIFNGNYGDNSGDASAIQDGMDAYKEDHR